MVSELSTVTVFALSKLVIFYDSKDLPLIETCYTWPLNMHPQEETYREAVAAKGTMAA